MLKKGAMANGKKELPDFFKKNKSLIVLLPVLVIGIVIVIILYAKPAQPPKKVSSNTPPKTTAIPDKNNEPPLAGNNVEILPQMERVTKPDLPIEEELRDPFSSEPPPPVMTLKGIACTGNGNTAVIETEDRAYVVSIGDKVAERWNVVQIEPQSVLLQDTDGNSLTLEF